MKNIQNNTAPANEDLWRESLDNLLTRLTTDVVRLREQASTRFSPKDEWFAIDATVLTGYYEVLLLRKRESTLYGTTRFGATDTDLHTALPDLYVALREELLTVPALLDALNHADTEAQVREQLSKGVRTGKAKEKGFRWDTSQRFSENFEHRLIKEDVETVARELFGHVSASDTVQLHADYEALHISTEDNTVIAIPFDTYPFLARAVIEADSQEVVDTLALFLMQSVREYAESLKEHAIRDAQTDQEYLDDLGAWKVVNN